jgi:hypothetical protein
MAHNSKDVFGGTPNPARETRALPLSSTVCKFASRMFAQVGRDAAECAQSRTVAKGEFGGARPSRLHCCASRAADSEACGESIRTENTPNSKNQPSRCVKRLTMSKYSPDGFGETRALPLSSTVCKFASRMFAQVGRALRNTRKAGRLLKANSGGARPSRLHCCASRAADSEACGESIRTENTPNSKNSVGGKQEKISATKKFV